MFTFSALNTSSSSSPSSSSTNEEHQQILKSISNDIASLYRHIDCQQYSLLNIAPLYSSSSSSTTSLLTKEHAFVFAQQITNIIQKLNNIKESLNIILFTTLPFILANIETLNIEKTNVLPPLEATHHTSDSIPSTYHWISFSNARDLSSLHVNGQPITISLTSHQRTHFAGLLLIKNRNQYEVDVREPLVIDVTWILNPTNNRLYDCHMIKDLFVPSNGEWYTSHLLFKVTFTEYDITFSNLRAGYIPNWHDNRVFYNSTSINTRIKMTHIITFNEHT